VSNEEVKIARTNRYAFDFGDLLIRGKRAT
jgi:hypothetical protein